MSEETNDITPNQKVDEKLESTDSQKMDKDGNVAEPLSNKEDSIDEAAAEVQEGNLGQRSYAYPGKTGE